VTPQLDFVHQLYNVDFGETAEKIFPKNQEKIPTRKEHNRRSSESASSQKRNSWRVDVLTEQVCDGKSKGKEEAIHLCSVVLIGASLAFKERGWSRSFPSKKEV
jgi:hypothetical protein